MPASALSRRGLHVAGTGSFALEIVEYARDAGHEVAALLELIDPARAGMTIHGLEVVALGAPPPGATVVIGAGGDRLAAWERLAAHGWQPAGALAHPRAHVSPSAQLGPGALAAPGAVIGAATTVGAHALVGRGALVGHHVQLGDGVVVNPGANVAGNTRVGAGAQIGMGALVANGLEVGAGAIVAAGAVVVRSVAPGVRVQGVPARPFAPGPEAA